ncbi:MAG: ABC transporter substrate-binding protein, partial [Candidatus Methanodesulfokora sp.]
GDRVKKIPENEKLKAVTISNIKDRRSPRIDGWGTARGQILELAGLIDVTKGELPPPGYGNVPLETLIKWNPDVIFLWPKLWSGCTPEDIYNDPAWQQISAVKNRRVYQLPLMSSWAPEFALNVLFYAVKAYPDKFKDVNFDEFYREFTKKVYGISLEPYYGG